MLQYESFVLEMNMELRDDLPLISPSFSSYPVNTAVDWPDEIATPGVDESGPRPKEKQSFLFTGD